MSYKVAIVGAGPAGCMVASNLNKNFEITLFDKISPLRTILPTGGGKCNLAHAEFNFKELAKNYPRGEKFLYSIFSKFGTNDTVNFFDKMGISTYIREDNRIFPKSNSSKDVREKFLEKLRYCEFKKEEVISIKKISNGFELKSNKATYLFDKIVIATGGKCNYKLISDAGHHITPLFPSLVGLKTNPHFKNLQGVSVKNCKIISQKKSYIGDILFTDNGITGPIIYEISSIMAKENFPYTLKIDFLNNNLDLQVEFDKNSKKNLSNLLAEYLPKSFVKDLLTLAKVDASQKCFEIRKETKEILKKYLNSFELNVTGTRLDGETVTCGGVDLNEINSKTMESKLLEGLYFCGEVLDIDGFCGGFNLQNCWSTGFIVADSLNRIYKFL